MDARPRAYRHPHRPDGHGPPRLSPGATAGVPRSYSLSFVHDRKGVEQQLSIEDTGDVKSNYQMRGRDLSKTTVRKTGRLAALVLVALALHAVGIASPAAAELGEGEPDVEPLTAAGCHVFASPSEVCVKIFGSGLTVTDARVDWHRWPPGTLCNTRIRLAYFDTNNHNYMTFISGRESRCLSEDRYINPGGYPFQARQGRACGSVHVEGTWYSGACVRIFR
jgi:hypothetical protein